MDLGPSSPGWTLALLAETLAPWACGDRGFVGLRLTLALGVWAGCWCCGYELDLGPVDLVGTLASVPGMPVEQFSGG